MDRLFLTLDRTNDNEGGVVRWIGTQAKIYTTYTSSFKGSYERMCSGDQNVVKELL